MFNNDKNKPPRGLFPRDLQPLVYKHLYTAIKVFMNSPGYVRAQMYFVFTKIMSDLCRIPEKDILQLTEHAFYYPDITMMYIENKYGFGKTNQPESLTKKDKDFLNNLGITI